MDRERAKQIIESHGVIEVSYDGYPIWIESIRGDNAEVTYMHSNKTIEVPLTMLSENDFKSI